MYIGVSSHKSSLRSAFNGDHPTIWHLPLLQPQLPSISQHRCNNTVSSTTVKHLYTSSNAITPRSVWKRVNPIWLAGSRSRIFLANKTTLAFSIISRFNSILRKSLHYLKKLNSDETTIERWNLDLFVDRVQRNLIFLFCSVGALGQVSCKRTLQFKCSTACTAICQKSRASPSPWGQE